MTQEQIEKYITDYKPRGEKEFQICRVDDNNFTFMVVNGKTIGAVLDRGLEPQLHILPEYRRMGHGLRLLKKYMIENELVLGNRYVYCEAVSDEGVALMEKFKNPNNVEYFTILDVGERKYIVLRDSRIK